ncbi:MAG: DUF6612 family protein [Christensenellales bacterium]
MKKIVLFLLVLLLGISCLACAGNSESAFSIYMKTMKNMESIKGMDATITADMSMNYAGQKIEMDMDSQIQQVTKSEKEVDLMMEMEIKAPALGMGDLKSMIYYTDGYYYMDTMNMKVKAPMDIEKLQSQSNANLLQFSLEMLKNSSVKKVDGNTVLTFFIDGEKAMDLISQFSSSYMNQLNALNAKMTAEDFTCELVVNSQYMPVSQRVTAKMNIEAQGQSISMDIDSKVTYNRFDDNLKISFPDFSDYTETDLSAIQ